MERIRPVSVEAAFLENAAPEFVYEYFCNHFNVEARHKRPFSNQVQKSLLARRSPIIDLALAQFSDESDVIDELFSRDRAELRIAAFSNINRLNGYPLLRHKEIGCLPVNIFENLIREGNDEELDAFFKNPEFSEHALAAVFARDGLYEELSDERWKWIVSWAITNPNLQKDTHKRFEDGWGYYSKTKPFAEAYKLPLLVEPSNDWAAVLVSGISRVQTH
jgi:hypothetical protein